MENTQDHCEAKNQETKIEDLAINQDQAAEVKAGAHKEWVVIEAMSSPLIRH
jgi:hypothetical protein